jgi:MscS family membrane protein
LLLKELPALLRRHPKVDPNVARVRFIGFGESSVDLQIHCHILTGAFPEFLAIREELLLQIMDLVVQAGTAFAVPARTLSLPQNRHMEQETRQFTSRRAMAK